MTRTGWAILGQQDEDTRYIARGFFDGSGQHSYRVWDAEAGEYLGSHFETLVEAATLAEQMASAEDDATPETRTDELTAIEAAASQLLEALARRDLALMGAPVILYSEAGVYGHAFGAKRLAVSSATFVVELFYCSSSTTGYWQSESHMAMSPETVRDLAKLARTSRT